MKLTKDEVRVARRMRERGASVRRLARDLGVTENAVRYRLRRLGEGDRPDGRTGKATALDGYEEAVEAIQERLGDGRLLGEGPPCQVRLIYEALVRDHGYAGSYQSVVRHVRRKHGKPRLRAIRRVETPAGVQAQHDWFEDRIPIGAKRPELALLLGALSYSRAKFCWPRTVRNSVCRTETLETAVRFGFPGLHDRLRGGPVGRGGNASAFSKSRGNRFGRSGHR